jgi:alanine dehydrogenase
MRHVAPRRQKVYVVIRLNPAMGTPIAIYGDDIRRVVDDTSVAEYVDIVRKGFELRGRGAPTKLRSTVRPNSTIDGRITTYLAYLREMGVAGGYMYTAGFEDASAWSTASLWDATAGEFLTTMDGHAWNHYKTGATGAVAVDELALEDTDAVGVIGSSRQAYGQILATDVVRDIEEVRVYSRSSDRRTRFAKVVDDAIGASVFPVDSSEEAVTRSEVVITATDSRQPVFDGRNLTPGTHVSAIGQYNPGPGIRELDATTIRRAKYVPDLYRRAFQDAGSFLFALENGTVTKNHVHCELGEVVCGDEVGREHRDEITVFDSGATAIEAVAAAKMLYDKARERGLGIELSQPEPPTVL